MFRNVDEILPDQLDETREINIYHEGIKELPSKFFTLGVQRVEIVYSDFERLPAEFALMKNLTDLSIVACQLVYVSPEIGNLSKLESLALSCNKLTRLPNTLKRLSLDSLYVECNDLSSVPCCSSLKTLDTRYNPGIIGFSCCNLKSMFFSRTTARVFAYKRPEYPFCNQKFPLESINACSMLGSLL